MTRKQILWAKQHDWFLSAKLPKRGEYEGGSVIVRGESWEPEEIEFADFKKLRVWAGY